MRGVSPSDCIFKNNSYLSHSLSLAPSRQRSKQNQATQSEQEESEQHTAQGEKRDDETTGRPTTITRPRYCRIGPGNGCASPHRAAPQIGGRRLRRKRRPRRSRAKAKGSKKAARSSAKASKTRGSTSTTEGQWRTQHHRTEGCTQQRKSVEDSRIDVDDRGAVAHSAPPHRRAASCARQHS